MNIHKLVKSVIVCLMLLGVTACIPRQSSRNFVGTWETDLFDSSNTLGISKDIAKGGAEQLLGDVGGSLAGLFTDMMSYDVTMEIREDGTVIVDSGELFYAEWYQKGNKIIIDGANIYGEATLASDGQTLYFKNTMGPMEQTTGLNLGNVALKFEFTRVE